MTMTSDADMMAAIAIARHICNNCLQPNPLTGALMFDEELAAESILSYAQQYANSETGRAQTYLHLLGRWSEITKTLNTVFPNEARAGEDAIKQTIRMLRWAADARESLMRWSQVHECLQQQFKDDIQLGRWAPDEAIRLLKQYKELRQEMGRVCLEGIMLSEFMGDDSAGVLKERMIVIRQLLHTLACGYERSQWLEANIEKFKKVRYGGNNHGGDSVVCNSRLVAMESGAENSGRTSGDQSPAAERDR